VRSALEEAGVDVQSAELSMEPKSTVEVGASDAPALLRLMDALEEHDDVDSVHANFDVPEEILERAAAAG
jgi:transcriptional/translational regulatory protein YebC/TACO1